MGWQDAPVVGADSGQSGWASAPIVDATPSTAPSDTGPAWTPQETAQGWRRGADGKVQFLESATAAPGSDGYSGFYADPDGVVRAHVAIYGQGKPPPNPIDQLPASSRPGLTDKIVHGMTLGLDTEADGLASAIGSAIAHPVQAWDTGGQSVADAYHWGRDQNLARLNYVDQHNPIGGTVADIGGMFLNPIGAVGDGVKGVMAGAGIAGGIHGFEDGDGSLGQRAANAGEEGVTSAILAPVLGSATKLAVRGAGKVIGRVAGRPMNALAAPVATEGQQILNAANRQGVNVLAADVGGPFTRSMTAGLAQSPLGAGPIIKRAQSAVETFKARVGDIAAMSGNATDDVGAGQAAQAGARRFMSTQEKKIAGLYNAIPIASQKPAVLTNTKAALAELNAGLASNPELSNLIQDPRLAKYEEALAGRSQVVPTGLLDGKGAPITRAIQKGGNLSWGDLKSFRTYVGEVAGRPTLQSDTSQAALKRLYAGLSADMRATAAGEGKSALAAFHRANSFYAAHSSRIENTVSQILGSDLNRSPEATFAQIQRWAKNGGDAAQVGRALRSMGQDQADTVRATIISRLGQAAPGRQNAAGDEFSVQAFLTHWNTLSPRAKSVLFTPEQRSALNDLAKVAGGMTQAAKFANHSNTAGAHGAGNLINNVAGFATLGGLAGHPVLAAGGLVTLLGQYGGARFLASPAAVRLATRAATAQTPGAVRAAANKLAVLASADPRIAQDATALSSALLKALNDNVPMISSAAASPDKRPQDQQSAKR